MPTVFPYLEVNFSSDFALLMNLSQANHAIRKVTARGYDLDEPWIAHGVIVERSVIHGRGLKAARAIPRGEVVMVLAGALFTLAEVHSGVAREQSVTGYSEGYYIGSPFWKGQTPDEYLNHSCDPNLWLVDAVTIIARRDIRSGEELTFDYATWEIDEEWRLPSVCNCGSKFCRGNITGADWRMGTLRASYGMHFLPCLLKRMASSRGAINDSNSLKIRRMYALTLPFREPISRWLAMCQRVLSQLIRNDAQKPVETDLTTVRKNYGNLT